MGTILITPRSLTRERHPAFSRIEDAGHEIVTSTPGVQPSEEELLELVPAVDGYLAGVEKISAKVLEAAKNLKVIGRNGVGIDNIDLEAAKRLTIKVCPTPGSNAQGVAELTIALMFSLARWIPFSSSELKAGDWSRRKGTELTGKTLGVIGCGNIGKRVAAAGAVLGMQVLGYDMYPDGSFSPSGFSWSSLEGILSGSDFVTLHCPSGNKPLIDSAAVSSMKKGAFLINTARAALVDEQAVITGLDSGRLAGYGVDVFDPEPPEDFTLAGHEKVIPTPHIGGFTKESVDRATVGAIEQILENIDG
ncbi:MAG: phosphoglycerate dehydrogenase [Spirochaetales bacterium]|nr:phosphoglycerate dehydrogenase [Spirochaetales bacterium]MCF7938472.1 phosphoglycerate dehydrogenase [Spirochaetales bacterium]